MDSLKVENLSKQLNYKIPQFHVHIKDKTEFNHVGYVIDIPGFIGEEYLSGWHVLTSDDKAA